MRKGCPFADVRRTRARINQVLSGLLKMEFSAPHDPSCVLSLSIPAHRRNCCRYWALQLGCRARPVTRRSPPGAINMAVAQAISAALRYASTPALAQFELEYLDSPNHIKCASIRGRPGGRNRPLPVS